MLVRTPLVRALAVMALVSGSAGFTSCSGGSSSASGTTVIPCSSGPAANVMCLVSCNLGCTDTGCELTEIAQNAALVFQFSQALDPRTVNSASLSLRTLAGEEPVGIRQVVNDRIEFVPEVQVVGGQTFFGFRATETYILTLQGGRENINALRSAAGDPLEKSLTCTLNVSLGIVDLNGVPPSASLLAPPPGQVRDVSVNTPIIIEFNELIDVAAFVGATSSNGPVRYRIRRTVPVQIPDPNNPGQQITVLQCSPTADPVPLIGAISTALQPVPSPRTQVIFKPATPLLGSICVQIDINDLVRDLSGKPAQPQSFEFVTEVLPKQLLSGIEDFDSAAKLDRLVSSATWANGTAEFGRIGGDGRHGKFNIKNGVDLGNGVYEWNTDNMVIPGNQTSTGQPFNVTDGVFQFTEMHVAVGQTLRLVGSRPAVITATGRIFVEGTIDAGGTASPGTISGSQSVIARLGTLGGPGAGSGGGGGFKGNGLGNDPQFDGKVGEDVVVPAGHAFAAQVVGTGGRSSTQFPVTGLNSSLVFFNFFCQMLASGGGGGGLITPGGTGRAISTTSSPPPPASWLGPDTVGGIAFDIVNTLTRPPGTPSLDFFLVGGSGGGGTGSHALFTNSFATSWWNGNGGTGGGGALALRAGDLLVLESLGAVTVRGGKAAVYVSPFFAPAQNTPAPGGAGSGGTLLLQVGRAVDLQGEIDARGGEGGRLDVNSPTLVAKGEGGDGGDGYYRLEMVGPTSTSMFPNALPPATNKNLGTLEDLDELVAFQSLWYFTNNLLGPEYVRYEIEALFDGQPVLLSDDPNISSIAAIQGQSPVLGFFQATNLDPITLQPIGVVDKPFRRYVGPFAPPGELSLADDAGNGYRFRLVLDRSLGQDVVIEKITVFYQF